MVEILPVHVRTALGTLAVLTAMTLEDHVITEAFLAKHCRVSYWIDAADAEDQILTGLARADASDSELKTAIEQVQLKRDGPNQASARQILWETVRSVACGPNAEPGLQFVDVALGGGKGIPFDASVGFQWFAYNQGVNDFVSGAVANVHGDITGIWL